VMPCTSAWLRRASTFPARQASLGAGLPLAAGCTTVNKMCGSGMRAMMFAHDMLAAGSADVIVAGGMESMTNAPHLVFARKGIRYGHDRIFDHMAMDGLEDAYERGKAMGVFAESCVAKFGFTREAQDAFSLQSQQRAAEAQRDLRIHQARVHRPAPGGVGDRAASTARPRWWMRWRCPSRSSIRAGSRAWPRRRCCACTGWSRWRRSGAPPSSSCAWAPPSSARWRWPPCASAARRARVPHA